MLFATAVVVLFHGAVPLRAHPTRPADAKVAIDRISGESSHAEPVQILRGAEAKAHLAELKSKRPSVFRMAERRMSARGYRPTEQVVVLRTARTEPSLYQPTQSIPTSEGEIVFWSWDDGDDSTWEGTMYISRYSNGAEMLQEAQFDIATATPSVMFESTIWKHLPGLEYAAGDDPNVQGSPVLMASLRGATATPQIELATSMPRPAREWLGCVVNGCLVGAIACAFSGPAYPECVVLVCAAVKLGCTVQIILTYL
ncbi:MAG TPA: hypothetical protein VHW00_11935 [Thermoanaerobaculia bacterium]|nr:hypothetical protein [Thermoanaerobaculia bacterium]